MDMSLIEKIRTKEARVGIIGLGYVGLPLVIEFCRAGFTVTGFDIDKTKIEALNQGKSYIRHIDLGKFRDALSGRFTASSDFQLLEQADCILIAVPTPLNRNREPDMTYVVETVKAIAGTLRKGQLVVLESTTYPGTTDELVRGILETTGLKAGEDFFLAFSRNGKTRTTTGTSASGTSRRSSAGTPRHALRRQSSCMSASSRQPFRSRPRVSRSPRNSSKTSTGPSISPWSTSSKCSLTEWE